MIRKFSLFRNYLVYHIFSSFFITIAIILAIATILPNLDARSVNPIDEKPLQIFQTESRNAELEYNLDEIFERGLDVATQGGFSIILMEPSSGILRGHITDSNMRYLHSFIVDASDPLAPQKRRFGKIELYGPFFVKGESRGYYQYFIDNVNPQREFVDVLFDNPWALVALLLTISTPILLWLSWRIARPVKELRLTANAVAAGSLTINPELEKAKINELNEVGQSFNQMILSLQRLTTYHQRLLSDISHELKTPLTRMQLTTSIMRRRNGESAEITRLENEIQKLNEMIMNLLALSRKEANQHISRNIFSINHIWDQVFEDAKFELEQNSIDLFVSLRIPFPAKNYINGNNKILSSALENLIRNAQKYAKSEVKVTAFIENNKLNIIVDDNGPGIPDGQYEDIFRPFYRVQEDRARHTGGTGLGLAIVLNAVQYHKGEVFAERSPLGGLRVTMKLPLWQE
ncbi:two-component system sensor histidine kinase CpxA [Pasteurellaceae bacterium LFhippo2]|nr:two-component system sensor histidine kinase CpxA [Pasteurellaceae bacterium LFhippo2]